MVSTSHKHRERLATTRKKSEILISVGYCILALALSTILLSVFSAHPRSSYGTSGLASGVFALLTGSFIVVTGRNSKPGYGETSLVLAIVLGFFVSVCLYVACTSSAQVDDPTVFALLLIFSAIQFSLAGIAIVAISLQVCTCCPLHGRFNMEAWEETRTQRTIC